MREVSGETATACDKLEVYQAHSMRPDHVVMRTASQTCVRHRKDVDWPGRVPCLGLFDQPDNNTAQSNSSPTSAIFLSVGWTYSV